MTLYADSSALVKRYVDEADSDHAVALLNAEPLVFTARHTLVEVRRNLARLVPQNLAAAREEFEADLADLAVVELDEPTCALAATIAEQMLVRSLDALHLGAAKRLGANVTFLTFDLRQAQAARSLGFTVVGA